MLCSHCGASCPEGSHFCPVCGAPLAAETSVRKGSHRVPMLIMTLLAVLGTVLFFLLPASAPSDTPWFGIRGGSLTFYESRYTGPEELEVPVWIDGQEVTRLADECFAGCDSLTTVILPDSLESIGWWAFENCTALRGIFIPEGVTEICGQAFAGCTALEAVSIPGSVDYVYNDAFDGCDSLRFIFYLGTYDEWLAVFGKYTPENVTICCTDGNYCQGRRVP